MSWHIKVAKFQLHDLVPENMGVMHETTVGIDLNKMAQADHEMA